MMVDENNLMPSQGAKDLFAVGFWLSFECANPS
jgi:hypothetical protein